MAAVAAIVQPAVVHLPVATSFITTKPSLTSAVEHLNAAYTQLRGLCEHTPAGQETVGPEGSPSDGWAALTEGDRQELGLFAEKVDDIVRRVAALQVRLERPE